MKTIYKFEAKNFNMEYTLDNLDFFSRGLYDLIRRKFNAGDTFTVLSIARNSTEPLYMILNSLVILDEFVFITKID